MAHSTLGFALGGDWHDGDDEDAPIVALCRGSETAFALLVDEYHAAMVRLASTFVAGTAAAEDVVQDVWLIVLCGIDKFQGRSSLKTWIFRILMNRAKTAGRRQARSIPTSPPSPAYWGTAAADQPEGSVLADDGLAIMLRVIGTLLPNLRRVIVLRDVEGREAKEVCGLLNLSEGNQRVLLHRARAQVRRRVQDYHEGNVTGAVA